MLNIFAKTFMTATGTASRNHWQKNTRFDERRRASFFPHNVDETRD